MRVTGGTYRGIPLFSPKNDAIRPTADRVRESLFNILDHNYVTDWSKIFVWDAFSGTGCLGIECLSRGAAFCLFSDMARPSIDLTRKNLEKIKIMEKTRLKSGDARKLSFDDITSPFNLVFLDPPYRKNLAHGVFDNLLRQKKYLAPDALIVVEMAKNHPETVDLSDFSKIDERIYGDTRIDIYRFLSP